MIVFCGTMLCALSCFLQRGIHMMMWLNRRFRLARMKKITALALLTLASDVSLHFDLPVYTIDEMATP